MSHGVKCWDAAGNVTFDSSAEHVLFYVTDFVINPSAVGSGITYAYPQYTGKKIAAFLQSPHNLGYLDGSAVMSCRVSYPAGIPTISVFFENTAASVPKCDGHLAVMLTGATQ